MPSGKLAALAAAVSTVSAFQGFNYGATFTDGSLKQEADFEADFRTAANLEGTDGKFTSARLYTMIQGNTDNEPISAIPAAIKTKTSLLFGLWASAGGDVFNNEITALQKTIDQYCDQLDGLVAGISVGSEDLYRESPIGIEAGELPGAGPDTLVGYIKKVRDTIKGTCLSNAPVGHVDTWTAYVNDTNQPLIEACDWLGMDAYPYFENTKPNALSKGKELFQAALDNTRGAAGGRDIWITETGWPVSGKTSGDAVPSRDNARTYWREVGCPMFGNTNVWWYTLQDSAPTTPNPSFGVIGAELTEKPLYDLSCDGVDTKPPTSSKPSSSKPADKPKPPPTKPADPPVESDPPADEETESETSVSSTSSTSTTTTEESTTATSTSAEEETTAPTATTVEGPAATPTNGTSTSSGGSGDNNSGDSTSDGGDAEPSTTTIPDGSGSQLKGSFGAAVVALVLAFFAL